MEFSLKLLVVRFWKYIQSRVETYSSGVAAETLKRSLKSAGKNMQLASDLEVDFADRIVIGDWVYVGPGGRFFGRGGLRIDDHVIIGPQVTIMTSMHNYRGARFIPYDETELLKSVEIGVASWIGLGAILLPGVVLGKGCIVGAGSVVTKSYRDGSIIAGNPARTVGMRDMDNFFELLRGGRTYLQHKIAEHLEKIEKSNW